MTENAHDILFLEFSARKDAMLNLEYRQCILFMFFQLVFLSGVASQAMYPYPLLLQGVAVAAFLSLLHMAAINFKIFMLARYLAEIETFFASVGKTAVKWDTTVSPLYIYNWKNFFFIPAASIAVAMVGQLAWILTLAFGVWVALAVGMLFILGAAANVAGLNGRCNMELTKVGSRES